MSSHVSTLRAMRNGSAGKTKPEYSSKPSIKNIPYRHGQTPSFVTAHFIGSTSKQNQSMLDHAKKTEQLEEKLKRFTSIISKRKTKTKVDKRKTDWIQEWKRLCDNEQEMFAELSQPGFLPTNELDCDYTTLRREWRELQRFHYQSLKICVDSPAPLVLLKGLAAKLDESQAYLKEEENEVTVEIDSLYNNCLETDSIHELEKTILATDYSSNQPLVRIRDEINNEVPIEHGEDAALREEMILRVLHLEQDYLERIKLEASAYQESTRNLLGKDSRPSTAQSSITELSVRSSTNSLLGGTYAGSEISSSLGGWTADDHFMYIKALKEYNCRVGIPKEDHQRSNMYQRLALYMNGKKTIKEIDIHDTWWMSRSRHKQKLKELRIQYLNVARPKLFENASHVLHLTAMLYDAHLKQAEEKKEAERKQKELHEKLDILKEEREQKDHENEEKQRQILMQLEQEQLKKEQREEVERAKAKLALLEHKEKKRELEIQEREKEVELERERSIQQAIERVHNKERVDHRKRELIQKDEERREKLKEQLEEKKRQEARLEKLRDEVKDRLGLDRVDRDFDRLIKQTEGSLMGEESASVRGFSVAHGYADNDLMKDIRFRLHVALCDAGMIDSSYAKSMLNQVKPAKQPRIDTFTSEQRFG